MAFSTRIYFKDILSDPGLLCSSAHDIPVNLQPDGSGKFIVFYNQQDAQLVGLNDGASIVDLGLNNIKIYLDQAPADSSDPNAYSPDGYYASTEFDGTNTVDTTIYRYERGNWGMQTVCQVPSTGPVASPNLDTEKNYQLDNVSKPLLRTNPKLSTNVKMVVDSEGRIYLDSINANQGLSNTSYKKYELSSDSRYAYDLSRYYNENNTPLDSAFDTKRDYSDFSVLDDYSKQFEEDYQYGTKLNASKLYSEDFRMMAPIWLDVNMPKKFVIYRVEDPTPEFDYTEDATDKLTRVARMMRNSRIVKVFDLSSSSSIGKYLRNHVQDEFFPDSPLTITMEKNQKSNFNGIDLVKGGFVEKGEYIYDDFVKQDTTLIDANNFITDGFRRNKVACANLINLEFMFNDPTATDYSVNRYFGLYVDDLDSGIGEISNIKNGLVRFKNIESYLQGNDPTYAIPEYSLLQSAGVLAYARIKDDFYNLDSSNAYNANRYNVAVKATDEEINSKLGINSKDVSVQIKPNETAGGDYLKATVIDIPGNNDLFRVTAVKREAVRLNIVANVSGETVRIEDALGNYIDFTMGSTGSISWANFEAAWNSVNQTSPQQTIDFYNRYELSVEADSTQINSIVLRERSANLVDNGIFVTTVTSIIGVKEIYTNVNQTIGTFRADNTGSLGKRKFNKDFFSAIGEKSDVAFAIAGAIRNYTDFDAYSVNEYVYIISEVNGYQLMNCTLLVADSNQIDFITAENSDTNNELNLSSDLTLNYSSYFFNGGHSAGKSVYVDSNVVSQIQAGDYLPTKYSGKYNLVLDVVEDTTERSGNFNKIILQDKSSITAGNYNVFSKNLMALGLFSAYDIHDMNFDFYDTSNSELKELKYETRENMDYEPYEQAVLPSVISEDFLLNPIEYFANLLPVLGSEDSKTLKVDRISSEYDRLKENYLKEYSTDSRVVPNINKWVLKDMLNVREQPYYLNTNEAFGKTNFSPDITVEGRNRDAFSHEWFYLDKWPEYLTYDQYNDGFSYIDFVEGFDVTKDIFKSVDHDYFDRFMVSEGHELAVPFIDPLNPTQNKETIFYTKTELTKKYTPIKGGSDIDFASTIFKGLKFEFKKRKDGSSQNTAEFVKTSEFNNYRFSTLVKVNTNANTNNIEYEFIKNDRFEYVIFFIQLNIEDSFIGDYINRKYLYELEHKIVFDAGQNLYKYADVNIDGAIELSSVNWAAQGPYTLKGVIHNDGSSPIFSNQMPAQTDGTYGRLKIDYGLGGDFYMDVVKVISIDQLQVLGAPYIIDSFGAKQPVNPYTIPYQSQLNAKYVYEGGGVNAHELLLSQLSANKVFDKVNNNSTEIKYTTVLEDGTELTNQFSVRMDDGNEIIKHSKLVVSIDGDTPKSYKLKKETIGYAIEEGAEYYPFLVRHNGRYTVDLTPVVTFTDIYGFNKVIRDQLTYDTEFKMFKEQVYKLNLSTSYDVNKSLAFYNRYNRMGTAFNVGFISDEGVHDAKWGKIKNHFYHKVNEINTLGVTKLSESSEYLPQYPLINEVAIDKRDINVFKSSWENNYYVRSLSGGDTELVPGTISTLEEKSYLGSTVIKYKPSYSIYEFTSSSVNSASDLDVILKNSSNKTDVVYFEDANNLIVDFYLGGIAAKTIGEDGLFETIQKFVNPVDSAGDKTTVEDDVTLYAANNMVGLYRLDDIQIYVKEYKGSPSEVISADSIDTIDNGYTKVSDFTYQLHGKKPLNFRLIYNKKLGYSYSMKALIKIQA
jgi:hypothetical protein